MTSTVAPDDLGRLLPSWELSLRAARRSPSTIKNYLSSASALLDFLCLQGLPTRLPDIRREHVASFMVALLDGGQKDSTARQHGKNLAPFFAWAVEERELDESPMRGLRLPQAGEPLVEVLREEQIAKLIDIKGRGFNDLRDAALLALLAETGMRSAEIRALDVGDIDLRAGIALVRHGKGDRARAVPFGARAGKLLDRYLRRGRVRHAYAHTPALWLGTRGRLGQSGFNDLVRRRGEAVGIEGLHPHQLRHTAAHHFLASGGREGDLMILMGWRDPAMARRYARATAAERALNEGRARSLVDRV